MDNKSENPNHYFFPNEQESLSSNQPVAPEQGSLSSTQLFFARRQGSQFITGPLSAQGQDSQPMKQMPSSPEQDPLSANQWFFAPEQDSHFANQSPSSLEQDPLPASQSAFSPEQDPLYANQPSLSPGQDPLYANQPSLSPEQDSLYANQQPLSPGQDSPFANQLLFSLTQPALQPERSKKPKNWVLVLAFVVVFLVGYGVGRIGSGGSTTTTTAKTVASANAVTPATTPNPTQSPTDQHFHTGQTVTTGSTWQIVVNSVKTDDGGQYSTLKSGNSYVVVDISLTNFSNNARVISSILNFTLQDSQAGQKYDESIDTNAGTTLDGNVEAHSQLHGVIAYEVPASVKSFTLTFSQSETDTSPYVWDLNL